MKLAVLEWVCGGGLFNSPLDAISSSLHREGFAMLGTVVKELSKRSEVEVVSVCDPRMVAPSFVDRFHFRWLDDGSSYLDQWIELSRSCDAAIVIAPEIDCQLESIIATMRAQGIQVLASDREFLRNASDKWFTYQAWQRAGIATPASVMATQIAQRDMSTLNFVGSWVIKPRDGAGCEGIRRFGNREGLIAFCEQMPSSQRDRWIVQDWLPGTAGSMTTLCGPDRRVALPACRQRLNIDDQVSYRGGTFPWVEVQKAAEDASRQALDALLGKPLGWIGIDFNWSEESGFTAIEINPRFTTSLVGMSSRIDELVWGAVQIALAHDWKPRILPGRIDFDTAGNAISIHATL